MVVGTSGAISTANRESTQRDAYITQERMPNAYRPLCGAKVIGEHVYVVGASRQVYRRAFGDHRWNKVDRKCQLPLEIESASGFHVIDGSAEHCCLAVGKHGSIWLGDVSDSGDIWTRVEHHLTTGDLHAVHHLGDNHFLVAGAHGIILRVNMLEVEGITHQVTTETFTTVVTAFGKTYLSTDQGNLFCLDQGALSAVETPFSEATGGSLAYADGLLMFATRQQVALFDGRAWEIITPTAYDSD
ncbi:MAG: hypothetical protein RSG77_21745 [Hafnia sp.]